MSDLIRRKDVLNLVSKGISTDTYEDMKYVIELINAIPSAEPKVGRWIEAESGLEYRCSECGEYVDKITIIGKSYLYNYCPNCGTRMKEDLDSINSCYKCAHAGTAPYDKPCSVCARNHRDHFEMRED